MPLRNIVIIAVMAVFSLACYGVSAKNRYANLFAEALETIDAKALYETPQSELFDAAMNGMLSKLDMHSQYFAGNRFKTFDEEIRQEFGGVGMYFNRDPETKHLRVSSAMPDTPAYDAGLLPGDQILEIEGESTFEMENGRAIEIMRGKPGTAVELKIESAGVERVVSLVREKIPVASVHGDVRNRDGTWNFRLKENPRVGYIRLTKFGDKSVDEFRSALNKLNGTVEGLIVDLRNNSGGLLTGAVDISDMFLDERLVIVRTKGRGEKLVDEHFSTKEVSFDPNLPLAILINRESASASEIVAACLRDHKRAVLIGESSWGKGTVQNVIPIQLHKSALKLTTASYWPPSDINFDRSELLNKTGRYGVHPDEGMSVEMNEEELVENYLQRQKRDLELLLDNDSSNGKAGDDPQSDQPHVDKPLQRAIEYFEKVFGKEVKKVAAK